MTTLGLLIGLVLTFFIFSFLYKDNIFFKFAEHLLVGISAGYIVAITFHNSFLPKFWYPLTQRGNLSILLILVPGLLGILFLGIVHAKTSWLVRYPFAFLLGTQAGLEVAPRMQASIFKQMHGTLTMFSNCSNVFQWASCFILLSGIICTMFYFFFIIRKKKVNAVLSRIGIGFLMVGFGASFGYTVMARISLLIERINYIIYDVILTIL